MIGDMLEQYCLISDHNISLIYHGPVWADVVEDIGLTLRKRLSLDALPLTLSQSVFSVFVEQMQNILNYSAERVCFQRGDTSQKSDVGAGMFILGSKDRQYFIQCGNKIRREQAAPIQARIDFLNTLDKTELRKHYKSCIRADNSNPESKGAGIGLIEIARRASSGIVYRFEEMDEGHFFFSLYVTIG